MKPCFLNFLLLLLMKKLQYPGGNGGALLPGLPIALNNIQHTYIHILYIYIYMSLYLLSFINLGQIYLHSYLAERRQRESK